MLELLLLPFGLMFAAGLLWYAFTPLKNPAPLPPAGARVQARLRWLGVASLVVGLPVSAYVGWRMQSVPEKDYDITGYEIGPGYSYPTKAGDSKRTNVQMERLQGKTGVAISDGMTWFVRRWQGQELAPTLATLSIAGFLGCFFLARYLTRPHETPASDEPATSRAADSPSGAPPA